VEPNVAPRKLGAHRTVPAKAADGCWHKAPDSGTISLQFICDALGFDLSGVQAAAFKLHRQAHSLRH
jgi:hypothetical protein